MKLRRRGSKSLPPFPSREFDRLMVGRIRKLANAASCRSLALWTPDGTVFSWAQLRAVIPIYTCSQPQYAPMDPLSAPLDDRTRPEPTLRKLQDVVLWFGRHELVIPAFAVRANLSILAPGIREDASVGALFHALAVNATNIVDILDSFGVEVRPDTLGLSGVAGNLRDASFPPTAPISPSYLSSFSLRIRHEGGSDAMLAANLMQEVVSRLARRYSDAPLPRSSQQLALTPSGLSTELASVANAFLEAPMPQARRLFRAACLADRTLAPIQNTHLTSPVFDLFGSLAAHRGWKRSAWLLLLRSLRPRLVIGLEKTPATYNIVTLSLLRELAIEAGIISLGDVFADWISALAADGPDDAHDLSMMPDLTDGSGKRPAHKKFEIS